MVELSPKSLVKDIIAIVKPEAQRTPVQKDVTRAASTSQPEKNVTKPRLSLVERQSLMNASRTTASDSTSRKRRISSLHRPIPTQPSLDIFRFPSESPPKQ